jgi:hypothetical protein
MICKTAFCLECGEFEGRGWPEGLFDVRKALKMQILLYVQDDKGQGAGHAAPYQKRRNEEFYQQNQQVSFRFAEMAS